jgi:preprotein translocase subunit SecY
MNFDPSIFVKAKDLKNKILYTIFILIICRVGSYITIPGINVNALKEIADANSNSMLGMFNMLSGGSLSRMSIFALGIVPYITSSIVMQLLTSTFKPLEDLKKEGEAGRRKINKYTKYLTIILASFQALGVASGLLALSSSHGSVVYISSASFKISAITSLVVGTVFLMWLGEQISARGIGNGTSLIIFTGIVAGLPQAFSTVFDLVKTGAMSPVVLIATIAFITAIIFVIIAMERAQRRILVNYPKKQKGNKIYGGESTHIPLKLNTAGVIPPIFAGSLLSFPLAIASFASRSGADTSGSILEDISIYLSHGKPLYIALYVALIIFFSFFYTSVVFNVQETAENLRKNGGFVHGRRPGAQTSEYFDYILTRLTFIGAIYMSLICALPEYFTARLGVPFYLGGTSFLIVVNVVMDTFSQIQTSLFAYQYESLLKKAMIRKR